MSEPFHAPHLRIRGDPKEAGKYLRVAKVFLDQLLAEMRLAGITSGSRTIEYKPGVRLTVSQHMNVPIIEIDVSGGKSGCKSCTLYMESGMLDLGANTAATWNLQPVVPSTAPQLYFGDTTDCKDGAEGTAVVTTCDDGRVSFGGGCQALDGDGDPVVSIESTCCNEVLAPDSTPIVTRADKTHCQAVLQPSLWTGLMHRHVQALYGNPNGIYKCATEVIYGTAPFTGGDHITDVPHLQLLASDAETWLDVYYRFWHDPGTCGIIDLGGLDLRYVVVSGTTAEFHKTTLTPCGEKLRKVVLGMPEGIVRDNALSYLLAQLSIVADIDFTLTFATPVLGTPYAYGWKFNPSGAEIAMATTWGPTPSTARLWRRTFVRDPDDGTVSVVEADGDEINYFEPGFMGVHLQILSPSPDNRSVIDGNTWATTIADTEQATPFNIDAPVYCYFLSDGTLEIVNAFLEESSETVMTFSPCYFDAGYVAAGDCPTFSDADTITAECSFNAPYDTHLVSIGFYSTRASNVGVSSYAYDHSFDPARFNTAATRVTSIEWVSSSAATVTYTHDVRINPQLGYQTLWRGVASGCAWTTDTTAGGCSLRSGSTVEYPCLITCTWSGSPAVPSDVSTCCPDPPTGAFFANIEWNPDDASGGGNAGWAMMRYTYDYNVVTATKKIADFTIYDQRGSALLIPAGSASSHVLFGTREKLIQGSAGTALDKCVSNIVASAVPIEGTFFYRCNYVSDTVDAPPVDMNGVKSGTGCDTDPVPCVGDEGHTSANTSSTGIDSITGTFGYEAWNITVLGFKRTDDLPNASVITLDEIDGTVFYNHTGTQTTFSFALASCAPPFTDDMTGKPDAPIQTMLMDPTSTYPGDLDNAWFSTTQILWQLFTNTHDGQKPSIVAHTSVGGAIAYFADYPALRSTLSDNHLTVTDHYPTIDRVSFVGWA